jgi:perosamine synthetase
VASVRTIGLSLPWLDEREEELVADVLRSGRLSLGPTIDRFEEAFAEVVGAPYAAAVSSGTAGLHLLCVAAGVGPGDEVVTSPYSFVASAKPRSRTGRAPSWPSTSTAIRVSSTSCVRCARRGGSP